MLYVLSLLGVLLAGAGYVAGLRRGRSREQALRTTLDERSEKLTRVEDELLRQSALDPATGVHTQQHFQEFLEREWRRASRERRAVSLLLIELDHFRAFQDRHGAGEADQSLRAIAAAIKPLVHRPSDNVARYGAGARFGVVLGATDSKGAMVLAERVRNAVESLRVAVPTPPVGRFVTASIGVASAMPDREGTWQEIELIAAAERALTRAAESGRNRVVLDSTEAMPRA